ncbi:hypothetical protein H9P43_009993 [Blastocladiella emersonii ATCC 22665]|nr:hypothetical protein H9P43_009993 [Blastocladiella emersonii ATCC 22665]
MRSSSNSNSNSNSNSPDRPEPVRINPYSGESFAMTVKPEYEYGFGRERGSSMSFDNPPPAKPAPPRPRIDRKCCFGCMDIKAGVILLLILNLFVGLLLFCALIVFGALFTKDTRIDSVYLVAYIGILAWGAWTVGRGHLAGFRFFVGARVGITLLELAAMIAPVIFWPANPDRDDTSLLQMIPVNAFEVFMTVVCWRYIPVMAAESEARAAAAAARLP